ncbi:Unknown protein, partial [Striga hermonthica]
TKSRSLWDQNNGGFCEGLWHLVAREEIPHRFLYVSSYNLPARLEEEGRKKPSGPETLLGSIPDTAFLTSSLLGRSQRSTRSTDCRMVGNRAGSGMTAAHLGPILWRRIQIIGLFGLRIRSLSCDKALTNITKSRPVLLFQNAVEPPELLLQVTHPIVVRSLLPRSSNNIVVRMVANPHVLETKGRSSRGNREPTTNQKGGMVGSNSRKMRYNRGRKHPHTLPLKPNLSRPTDRSRREGTVKENFKMSALSNDPAREITVGSRKLTLNLPSSERVTVPLYLSRKDANVSLWWPGLTVYVPETASRKERAPVGRGPWVAVWGRGMTEPGSWTELPSVGRSLWANTGKDMEGPRRNSPAVREEVEPSPLLVEMDGLASAVEVTRPVPKDSGKVSPAEMERGA